MDFGNCVPLYNHHRSENIIQVPCPERFPRVFQGWCSPPSPHSTSRNCCVNFLALFRWSHDTPGERAAKREIMPNWWPLLWQATWGKLSMSFAFLMAMWCMFLCQWAIIPCSALNEDLGAMMSLALECSVMVIPGESWEEADGPLKQLLSSPNVLTSPWWPSFLSTNSLWEPASHIIGDISSSTPTFFCTSR